MEKLLLIGIDTRSMLNSALKLDYDIYSTSYFSTSDTPTIKNQKIILQESDGESCGIFEDNFNSKNILEISKDYIEEVDHIIPISEGGTNKLSNLRCVTRIQNNNNPNTRANNSRARINGSKSRPVIQTKEDGEVIRWASISEAERNGYSHNCIVLCCQGKRPYHRRSSWKYA